MNEKIENTRKFLKWFRVNLSAMKLIPSRQLHVKVKNRNNRTRCELCSKITIKIPERHHWHCSRIFIVNFEHILHLVVVFLMLTLSR